MSGHGSLTAFERLQPLITPDTYEFLCAAVSVACGVTPVGIVQRNRLADGDLSSNDFVTAVIGALEDAKAGFEAAKSGDGLGDIIVTGLVLNDINPSEMEENDVHRVLVSVNSSLHTSCFHGTDPQLVLPALCGSTNSLRLLLQGMRTTTDKPLHDEDLGTRGSPQMDCCLKIPLVYQVTPYDMIRCSFVTIAYMAASAKFYSVMWHMQKVLDLPDTHLPFCSVLPRVIPNGARRSAGSGTSSKFRRFFMREDRFDAALWGLGGGGRHPTTVKFAQHMGGGVATLNVAFGLGLFAVYDKKLPAYCVDLSWFEDQDHARGQLLELLTRLNKRTEVPVAFDTIMKEPSQRIALKKSTILVFNCKPTEKAKIIDRLSQITAAATASNRNSAQAESLVINATMKQPASMVYADAEFKSHRLYGCVCVLSSSMSYIPVLRCCSFTNTPADRTDFWEYLYGIASKLRYATNGDTVFKNICASWAMMLPSDNAKLAEEKWACVTRRINSDHNPPAGAAGAAGAPAPVDNRTTVPDAGSEEEDDEVVEVVDVEDDDNGDGAWGVLGGGSLRIDTRNVT